MIDPEQVIDFAHPADLGSRLMELLGRVEALERITPGMTVDWGIEVGAHVYQLKIKVRRDLKEVTA